MQTAWKFMPKVPSLRNVVAPVSAFWSAWLPKTLYNKYGGFHD